MYKYSDEEFEKLVKGQALVGQDFFEAAFKYWYNDHDDKRSPFPEKIQGELSRVSTRLFMEWVIDLQADDPKDENTISSQFAAILFETAMGMVTGEDEKISLLYPNLPRMGDVVNSPEEGVSTVLNREMVQSDGMPHLKLFMTNDKSGQVWETLFPLEDGPEKEDRPTE